MNGFKNLQ